MNHKDFYKDGDTDSEKKNTSRHKKRTSDTSLGEEDPELGKSQRHSHHHNHQDSKNQSKHDKDEGMANLKNDGDYNDLIAETHDGTIARDAASSDCYESLENFGKTM